jgi:hypothetical protein
MQIKITKISYLGTLSKVQFIQDSGLFCYSFYQISNSITATREKFERFT